MKTWMWILIAIAILGAGVFLYFKMRKKATALASSSSPGLDTISTSKVTAVSPLTNKQAAPTTKNATDTPVSAAVMAQPTAPPVNWDAYAQAVYTPTLDGAGVSASVIAQLAAQTYTPEKAQAYTEQNWTWKVADAKMLESMGGWPASVALA
jgi:hypothetical protein